MRALIYIVMLMTAVGCSYSGSQSVTRLDVAQRLVQTDPKSALERLNAIDVSSLEDSSLMARWALLYSEAMVANRLNAPSDTIIGIAIDYYGRHNIRDAFRRASELKALMINNGNNDELATALYLQKEKEFMLYKERTKREQYVYIGVIIFCLAFGIIVWQRQRMKVKDIQKESLIAEASSLRAGIVRQQSECSELESKLLSILSTRFNLIDDLCETYYESQGTKAERKAIVDKVKSQIESLKTDDGLFAEMEYAVNNCQNDLLINLQNELPGIKPDEYRLAVYLASNLSNRSIALLLGENIDVVYKRKSRLKAKISSMDSPNSERFRDIF